METRISVRIDQDLKTAGVKVLDQLGLTITDLINLTFHQLVLRQGLPFDAKAPNTETVDHEQKEQSARERQFHDLKADLERAVTDAENGNFADFDPHEYEPDYK